jgi:hypothetical protein
MASRVLIAYLAMVFKMVRELPLGVWEWRHWDLSVQRVAMFTYLGQTRIQASRWTFCLHIKLLTIKEYYTQINITQNLNFQNMQPNTHITWKVIGYHNHICNFYLLPHNSSKIYTLISGKNNTNIWKETYILTTYKMQMATERKNSCGCK